MGPDTPPATPVVPHRERLGVLRVPLRPWVLNAERRGHWRAHREETQQWRELSRLLASGRVSGHAPILPVRVCVGVEAFPVTKGNLADTGNHYPAVKAALDGLVDARVLADDDGQHISSITLHAPRRPLSGELEHLVVELWAAW